MLGNQEWVTPNAFSKAVGVSLRAVLDGVQSGRFSKACLKEVQTQTGKKRYQIELHQGQVEWDVNRGGSVPIGDDEYKQDKRREQKAKADIEEMKARQLEGDLVLVSDVESVLAKLLIRLREGLSSKNTRLAPVVSGCSDVRGNESAMNKADTELLQDLARAAEGGELIK